MDGDRWRGEMNEFLDGQEEGRVRIYGEELGRRRSSSESLTLKVESKRVEEGGERPGCVDILAMPAAHTGFG